MSDRSPDEKSLSLPMLACVMVVYLSILQGGTLLLTKNQHYSYAEFPTIESIIRSVMIPVGLSVVFVSVVILWLGWWKRIFNESNRLSIWAWIVPILMVLSIIVVTNYPVLAEVSPLMVISLLASVILVGIGEELMFRGVVLETMRQVDRATELKAALWTALIFGGVHISNIFTEGATALLQAVIVSVSGLFFYVAYRVSGTLLVPIVLHAAWDFSLFSGNLGLDPEPSPLALIPFMVNLVLAIIVFVKWRTIWPEPHLDKTK